MVVIFSSGAKEDLTQSILYFENEVDGLGKAFYGIIKASSVSFGWLSLKFQKTMSQNREKRGIFFKRQLFSCRKF